MDRQVRRDLRLVDVEVAGDVTVLLTELGLGGVDAHLAVYESRYRPAEGVEGDPVAMGPLSGSGRRLEKRKNLSLFPPSRVLILHVPDCPLVERLRAEVESALAEVAAPDVRLSLVEGDYPSPTLLVDGMDVTTGAAVSGDPRCRLDLPTAEQIRDALARLTEGHRGSANHA